MSEQPCIIDLSRDDEDIVRDCVTAICNCVLNAHEPCIVSLVSSDDESDDEAQAMSESESDDEAQAMSESDAESESDAQAQAMSESDDESEPEPEPEAVYQPAHTFEDVAGLLERTGILETFLAGGPTLATMSTSWWTYWLSNKALDTWFNGVWTRTEQKMMILSLHPDKANSLRDARMTEDDHRWMDKLSQNLNGALNVLIHVIPSEMYDIIYLPYNTELA